MSYTSTESFVIVQHLFSPLPNNPAYSALFQTIEIHDDYDVHECVSFIEGKTSSRVVANMSHIVAGKSLQSPFSPLNSLRSCVFSGLPN